MEHWLGEVPEPLAERARATPSWSRRWLRTFGPGTAHRPAVGGSARPRPRSRRALADVDAVEVSLDGGGTGWVLPDDLDAGRTPWSRGRRCCRCSTRR